MNNLESNKAQLQNKQLGKEENFLRSSEIQGFEIKKSIAKIKNSKNKIYKQRPIVIVPIYYDRFNNQQTFIINGFIEIETQYRDFSDPQELETISIQNKLLSIKSIEKKNNLNALIFNIECNGFYGLYEFQFLIDHFSKQPNADFYKLSQYLSKYQENSKEVKKNISNLQQQILQRTILKSDINQAISDYQEYFFEQIKSSLSEDDFFIGTFCALNLETKDIEPKMTVLSKGFLSLSGIEMNEEQELLHQSVNFYSYLGRERLEAASNILDFLLNIGDKKTYEQSWTTSDHINFRPKIEYQFIDWPQRPSYLQKIDLFGLVLKFEVPLYQLKSIIEIRKQNNSQGYLKMQDLLDYQIQTEIFIEKFYPQLSKNQEKLNELSLRQLNKLQNKCS
ncbi:hypothetical protein ABPG74_010816 [Tetrahymena malaccensis]